MKKARVAINGFGRIGRCAFRSATDRDDLEIVAINDLGAVDDLAYLLKYDSIHGPYSREVSCKPGSIRVGDRDIAFFSVRNPAELPWRDLGIDVVIESTGVLTKRAAAAMHLDGGARHVVISAPSKDADATFVLGVNEHTYDPAKHRVISMASCTTNCLAPVAKVLHEAFGVEHMMITTVHAYTSTQGLLDMPTSDDKRRGRAAAVSIIPTSTGAAKATALVLPALAGKVDGLALRVPVPDGSITDVVAFLHTDVTVQSVNDALREAASKAPLKGILAVSEDPLVSRDIVGNPHSSIIDASSTMVMGSRVVKVLSWYDNEWGYATRLLDFSAKVAAHP